MKTPRLLAVAAAILASVCSCWQAFGQAVPAAVPVRPAVAPRPSSIGLLNVGYLFENHPRLKQMREEMKADVERADQVVRAEQENIKKQAESLEQYRGTPDAKAIEEQVARRSSELKLQVAMQRKEFMLREARMYHQTYQEIYQEVEYYCQQNGVDLVLRFNADKVDMENPESVLVHVNRPIVWQSPDRDITGFVLQSLQRRYPAAVGVNPAVRPTPFQR